LEDSTLRRRHNRLTPSRLVSPQRELRDSSAYRHPKFAMRFVTAAGETARR
jgi:hypothetical protein